MEYQFCMILPTFAMLHFFVLVRSSCTVGKIVCEIITRNQLGIVTYHVSSQNYVFICMHTTFSLFLDWLSKLLTAKIVALNGQNMKVFLPYAKKSQYKFICLKSFAETTHIPYYTINLLSSQFYHRSRYLLLKI